MLRGLVLDYGGVLTDGWTESGEPPLVGVLRLVRERGVRTGLLSNAAALGPAPAGLLDLLDAVVLSAEVGFGKPDPRIYRLTARRLDLAPADCVFVDDIAVNVRAAAEVGMVGVHHQSVEATLNELEILLEFPLGGSAQHFA